VEHERRSSMKEFQLEHNQKIAERDGRIEQLEAELASFQQERWFEQQAHVLEVESLEKKFRDSESNHERKHDRLENQMRETLGDMQRDGRRVHEMLKESRAKNAQADEQLDELRRELLASRREATEAFQRGDVQLLRAEVESGRAEQHHKALLEEQIRGQSLVTELTQAQLQRDGAVEARREASVAHELEMIERAGAHDAQAHTIFMMHAASTKQELCASDGSDKDASDDETENPTSSADEGGDEAKGRIRMSNHTMTEKFRMEGKTSLIAAAGTEGEGDEGLSQSLGMSQGLQFQNSAGLACSVSSSSPSTAMSAAASARSKMKSVMPWNRTSASQEAKAQSDTPFSPASSRLLTSSLGTSMSSVSGLLRLPFRSGTTTDSPDSKR